MVFNPFLATPKSLCHAHQPAAILDFSKNFKKPLKQNFIYLQLVCIGICDLSRENVQQRFSVERVNSNG